MRNKVISTILAVSLSIIMAGCSSTKEDTTVESETTEFSTESSSTEPIKLKIGSSGSHGQMVDILADMVKDKGIEIETVLFDSNAGPADACCMDDIDAFMLNHIPWLEQYDKDNGADIAVMSPLYYVRTALYSEKYNSIEEIPDGGSIAFANDSTNMEAALLFLQDLELIKLGEKTESFYTPLDIVENPKNLEFVTTEISFLARNLEECDAVICNAQAVRSAEKDHTKYIQENLAKKNFPAGLSLREKNADTEWAKILDETLHSSEYKERFDEIFQGTLVILE